jgi:archaellum component FlaC
VARSTTQALLKDNLLKQAAEIRGKLSASSSSGGDGGEEGEEVDQRSELLTVRRAELNQATREADKVAERMDEVNASVNRCKQALRDAKRAIDELRTREAAHAEAIAEMEKGNEKLLNKR